MRQRIVTGDPKNPVLVRAAPEDIEAHLQALRQLAAIANQAMNATIAFQLRMQFAISELEIAYQRVASTDLRQTKQLLTLKEAARRLGVPAELLRKNVGKGYPVAHRGSGRSLVFRRADVERWLEQQ